MTGTPPHHHPGSLFLPCVAQVWGGSGQLAACAGMVRSGWHRGGWERPAGGQAPQESRLFGAPCAHAPCAAGCPPGCA